MPTYKTEGHPFDQYGAYLTPSLKGTKPNQTMLQEYKIHVRRKMSNCPISPAFMNVQLTGGVH